MVRTAGQEDILRGGRLSEGLAKIGRRSKHLLKEMFTGGLEDR
jgi:hypothetical protein